MYPHSSETKDKRTRKASEMDDFEVPDSKMPRTPSPASFLDSELIVGRATIPADDFLSDAPNLVDPEAEDFDISSLLQDPSDQFACPAGPEVAPIITSPPNLLSFEQLGMLFGGQAWLVPQEDVVPAPIVLPIPTTTTVVDYNDCHVFDCGHVVKNNSLFTRNPKCPSCHLEEVQSIANSTIEMFQLVATCNNGHACNQTCLRRANNANRKCPFAGCDCSLQYVCRHCGKVGSYQTLSKKSHACFDKHRRKNNAPSSAK